MSTTKDTGNGKATPKSAQLHGGPGFRIRRDVPRPDPRSVAQFREYNAPDVSDMLNRMYTMSSRIRRLSGEGVLVGPACTVKVFPGDNLMVHKSLDIARPGDIIVIDACGSEMNALIGDLISTKAQHRGIAGFIVDGLVRDLDEIRELGMTVFARGTTPIGPLHRGPGEINYPISCGNIVVNPGDLLVADVNGIVAVRQDFLEATLARLRQQRQSVAGYEETVRRGIFSNEWVDTVLEASGCLFEGVEPPITQSNGAAVSHPRGTDRHPNAH